MSCLSWDWLKWTICGMCLSRFILFFLSFFSFLVLAFSLSLFHLPFYLTVPLYVLSLRWSWPWTWSSLSWACKMCKAKICRRKSFYNQIIMKNKGIWAHNFSRKEKKIFRRLQLFSIQVVKFLRRHPSNLFASTKIYLLLNQNCKKKKKERKATSHLLCGWRFSAEFGSVWLVTKPHFPMTFCLFPVWKVNSDRYKQYFPFTQLLGKPNLFCLGNEIVETFGRQSCSSSFGSYPLCLA